MSTPGMYDNAKERFIAQANAVGGAVDLATTDVRAQLIDDGMYTANFATDIDDADVAAAAEISDLAAGLGTKTTSAGVFDAADDTFTSVSGATIESTLVYEFDAIEANAELFVLLDNGGATTPNGNDINIVWDAGANRIFALN